MTTLLLCFGLMLLVTAAMAIGVLFGRAPISGSCGGMKRLGIDGECEICGGDPARCDRDGGSADAKVRTGSDAAARLASDVYAETQTTASDASWPQHRRRTPNNRPQRRSAR